MLFTSRNIEHFLESLPNGVKRYDVGTKQVHDLQHNRALNDCAKTDGKQNVSTDSIAQESVTRGSDGQIKSQDTCWSAKKY